MNRTDEIVELLKNINHTLGFLAKPPLSTQPLENGINIKCGTNGFIVDVVCPWDDMDNERIVVEHSHLSDNDKSFYEGYKRLTELVLEHVGYVYCKHDRYRIDVNVVDTHEEASE